MPYLDLGLKIILMILTFLCSIRSLSGDRSQLGSGQLLGPSPPPPPDQSKQNRLILRIGFDKFNTNMLEEYVQDHYVYMYIFNNEGER